MPVRAVWEALAAAAPSNQNGGNGGSGGQGGDGGGLSTTGTPSAPGSLTVTNSTLTANRTGLGGTGGKGGAAGSGGKQGRGGQGGAGGSGGAIAGISSPSRMASATIAGNSQAQGGNGGSGSPDGQSGAAGDGGGLYANASSSAFAMTLQNTLVASNTTDNCAVAKSSKRIANGGYDLSFPDKTCPAVTNRDPKLKKLAGYGGFTFTMALEPGSAAINKGPPKGAGCPARDQRAVRRPQGKACDIGAFEFAVPSVSIYTPRNGARYKRGSRVLANYRCTEGGSSTTPITPIATCNGTVLTGQRINTRTLGRKTFTVTAGDQAGNKTVKTIHYTVVRRR